MTLADTKPLQPKRYRDGIEWRRSLGNVAMGRIVFDPWPGFATEQDLIQIIEGSSRPLCELVDGTLVEKCVGNCEDYIAALLLTQLNQFVLPRNLGFVFGSSTMMRVQPTRVRVPDVAFVRKSRLRGNPEKWSAIFTGGPDIAVQVISPGNRKAEMSQKLREYFVAGSRLVWYVYPKTKIVRVYHSANEEALVVSLDGSLKGGDVLPGFVLNVRDIFPRHY